MLARGDRAPDVGRSGEATGNVDHGEEIGGAASVNFSRGLVNRKVQGRFGEL